MPKGSMDTSKSPAGDQAEKLLCIGRDLVLLYFQAINVSEMINLGIYG